MFAWLKQRKNLRNVAERLYGAIVTQARAPVFYQNLGIPDSLEGRYEILVVHLVLILERLRAEGPKEQDLARTLVERFVTDMDDAMRQLGVGDTSVPKKVKGAAAGLFERTAAYRQGLAADPAKLAAELGKYLGDGPAAPTGSLENLTTTGSEVVIARYLQDSARMLAAQPLEDMLSKAPQFAALRQTP